MATNPTVRTSSLGWSSALEDWLEAPAAPRLEITRVIASAYGRAAETECCALTMRDAAMSSIALVIFLVDWTLRMRLLRTRSWPPATDDSPYCDPSPAAPVDTKRSVNSLMPDTSASSDGTAPGFLMPSRRSGGRCRKNWSNWVS